jgi:hydrogenase nickel incorporation protein HypA/HybF
MHEMTIAMNIIDLVTSRATTENARQINRIELEVGELSGVMIDSLRFCFDLASRNTLAEGAELTIDAVPGHGTCHSCGRDFPINTITVLCPHCGNFGVEITRGKELKIRSINID